MKRILEEFYEGNLHPSEASFAPNGEYAHCLEHVANAEESLRRQWESAGGQADALLAYRQAQEALNAITAKEQFLRGFRLGLRLGIEVADDRNPSEFQDVE